MKSPIKVFIILFSILSYSCTNGINNDVICEEFNIKPTIKECKTYKELPEGVFPGEVIAYKGRDKIEENMLSQFSSYNLALLRGDYDNACRYQYPDAVKYFRKFYPAQSDDTIMRNFFSSMSNEMIQSIRRYEEHGIELSIIVSRVKRKISQKNNIIYVFEIVSNMIGEKLQIHTTPDETIAISTNAGKNWTFNAVNEDTPNILRVSYSDEVVDKVMGY
jgi:hypothetical protein